MAISNKCIAYSDLLEQLDIGCVRELEDLIIESIYAGTLISSPEQSISPLSQLTTNLKCFVCFRKSRTKNARHHSW